MTEELHGRLNARDSAAAKQKMTATIPMRRYGAPEEVAALVAFLLSSEASYVNGGLYTVDGAAMAVIRTSRRTGDDNGDVDGIGDPRPSAQGAGHGHAVLPDGWPDARDGERARPARHEDDRHPPRAGRRDDGPRVDAPDEEARRLHGLVGAGHDQHAHRRGQCLDRRLAADRHRRVEPARVARHGGLPGDRPGRRCSGPPRNGRSASTMRAAFRRSSRRPSAMPPRAGPARSTSTCPATSWARRWTRASSRYPGPAWKPTPRSLGDPAAVKEAIALLAKAERPLILGGSGVWWSDAAAAFQAFVEATGMPFYTTPLSRGTVPGRPSAGLPQRPRQGLRRGRRHPEHRHPVQLRRPVLGRAALRGQPQGDPGRRQPGGARPQPPRRRAHRGRRARRAPAARRRGEGHDRTRRGTRPGHRGSARSTTTSSSR